MCFFFFNDTATTEIYTLSLHDALPISVNADRGRSRRHEDRGGGARARRDRKSTRLNSSHANISYAVFCLKKKKNNTNILRRLKHQHNYSRLDLSESKEENQYKVLHHSI